MTKQRRDTLETLCLTALFVGMYLVAGLGWAIIVVAGLVLTASVLGAERKSK